MAVEVNRNVALVYLEVARFLKNKSLKGSEKPLNLATKSPSWQHCLYNLIGITLLMV